MQYGNHSTEAPTGAGYSQPPTLIERTRCTSVNPPLINTCEFRNLSVRNRIRIWYALYRLQDSLSLDNWHDLALSDALDAELPQLQGMFVGGAR